MLRMTTKTHYKRVRIINGKWRLNSALQYNLSYKVSIEEWVNRETGEVDVSWCDTHDGVDESMANMLAAEVLNDLYEFSEPYEFKSRRPQLMYKLYRCQLILDRAKRILKWFNEQRNQS